MLFTWPSGDNTPRANCSSSLNEAVDDEDGESPAASREAIRRRVGLVELSSFIILPSRLEIFSLFSIMKNVRQSYTDGPSHSHGP